MTTQSKMEKRRLNAEKHAGTEKSSWWLTSKKPEQGDTSVFVPIVKRSEERNTVYGFASVSDLSDKPYFDSQGDHIPIQPVREAFHEFMASGAAGYVNHEEKDKGRVVEGLVIDDEIAAVLKKELDAGKRGLFIAYKVKDPEVWNRVKKGEFTGFSLGGQGRRKRLST